MAFIPNGFVVKLGGNYRLVGAEVSRKAEIKDTTNGKKFCKFSVCAGVKPNTEDEKLYIDCVAYQRGNNTCLVGYCGDLDRGDPVLLAGELKARQYNGKTYLDLELLWANSPAIAPDVTPYSAPQSNGGGNGSYGGYGGQPEFHEEDSDEDLPF